MPSIRANPDIAPSSVASSVTKPVATAKRRAAAKTNAPSTKEALTPTPIAAAIHKATKGEFPHQGPTPASKIPATAAAKPKKRAGALKEFDAALHLDAEGLAASKERLRKHETTVRETRQMKHQEHRITRPPVVVTRQEQRVQQDKRRKAAETYSSLFALQASQMPDMAAVLLAVAGQFRHLTKLLQRPTHGTATYVSAIERRWRTVTINASTTLC